MKFTSDIDIDLADRDVLLSHLDVVAASIRKDGPPKKHNTGVHPTEIPYDPVNRMCALDYRDAEERGYVKLDLLNVHVYKSVESESHLIDLMHEPDWSKLQDQEYFHKLIHIGKHWNTMLEMPEPINSIPRLAMFLAIIRPGKRHLIGKPWSEVAKTIWDRNVDGYTFRKSHAIAYAHLVVVQLNLLIEELKASSLQE
jgi:hypothetical protein